MQKTQIYHFQLLIGSNKMNINSNRYKSGRCKTLSQRKNTNFAKLCDSFSANFAVDDFTAKRADFFAKAAKSLSDIIIQFQILISSNKMNINTKRYKSGAEIASSLSERIEKSGSSH